MCVFCSDHASVVGLYLAFWVGDYDWIRPEHLVWTVYCARKIPDKGLSEVYSVRTGPENFVLTMSRQTRKTGSDGAQNTANKLDGLLDVLGFPMYLLGGGLFNYSKMHNLGFRMNCNTFWIIFGTSKNRPNMDHWTPYLLQRYIETYKQLCKHFINNIMFVNLSI